MPPVTSGTIVANTATVRIQRRLLSCRPPGDGHADEPHDQRESPAEGRQPLAIGQRDDQLGIDAQAAEGEHVIRARGSLEQVDLEASRAEKILVGSWWAS